MHLECDASDKYPVNIFLEALYNTARGIVGQDKTQKLIDRQEELGKKCIFSTSSWPQRNICF
jgi:hypothetical protein